MTTNPDRSVGLNHDYNMTFSISPLNVSILHLKYEDCARIESRVLLPLLRHVVPLNDGNCRLTIPVVKERCARDPLPQIFNSGVFKVVKTISTAIKHIYQESAKKHI